MTLIESQCESADEKRRRRRLVVTSVVDLFFISLSIGSLLLCVAVLFAQKKIVKRWFHVVCNKIIVKISDNKLMSNLRL